MPLDPRTLALLALAAAAGLALCCAGQNIAFQIHSYNDLRLWPQAFAKGAKWAKVDAHYQPASFCVSQTSYDGDPRGCFVLSHDAPSPDRQYNTTGDVLAYMAADLATFANPDFRIFVAFCFKVDVFVPCDNSTSSDNFISLTSSLVDDMLAAAATLNVQFVLDGNASPSDDSPCLDELWTELPSTWTGNPPQPTAGAFSNNSAGYSRFDVFDMPVPTPGFEIMVHLGYGKFADAPWPLLVWEPSSQALILAIADIYLAHQQHPAGLRFAINIDPAQFQVYAANASGLAWNSPLASGTGPLIAVVNASAGAAALRWMVVLQAADGALMYGLWDADAPFVGTPQSAGPLRMLPSAEVLGNSTDGASLSVDPQAGAALVSAAESGRFALLALDASGSLSPVLSGQIPMGLDDTASATCLLPGPTASVLAVVAGSGQCGLSAAVLPLGTDAAAPAWVCVSGLLLSPLERVSVSAAASALCDGGWVAAVAGSDSGSVVSMALLCVDSAGAVTVLAPLTAVDVGDAPRLALATDAAGALQLLEVHGSGYCWSTSTNNKQPLPATCDNVPISTPYILNFNYGPLLAWAAVLTGNATLLSPCNATSGLLHGTYDSGLAPSVALAFATPPGAAAAVPVVLEAHTSLPVGAVDVSGCGLAVPTTEPLVLADSWPIESVFAAVDYSV